MTERLTCVLHRCAAECRDANKWRGGGGGRIGILLDKAGAPGP
jgi:hypothetical protein